MSNDIIIVQLPDTNLLFTRETLYPMPTSSNSTPDRVVPSQLNWAAMVPWDPGPSDNWNLALTRRYGWLRLMFPPHKIPGVLTWCYQYHQHQRTSRSLSSYRPARHLSADWPCLWPPRPQALISTRSADWSLWKHKIQTCLFRHCSRLTSPWNVGCTCSQSWGRCEPPRTSSMTWCGMDRSWPRLEELFGISKYQYWNRKPAGKCNHQ